MKQFFVLLFAMFFTLALHSQKTVHVFVALCDNVNQGIVPVPESIGNGQNPNTNLYWGCGYGIRTYFKKSEDWIFLQSIKNPNANILERILFKHKTQNVYLLADAYDGARIKQTNLDFLSASANNLNIEVEHEGAKLQFGGAADLVAYIGHNGLMDFTLPFIYENKNTKRKDAIVLACISHDYYTPYLKTTGAHPLLLTTNYMAPEAYTLKWALDGWVLGETGEQIRERAGQAYNHYQKCGINGARKLFKTGW